MKAIVFQEEAEAELRAAIAYYNERREGLGDEFQAEVERATGQIVKFPQACPPYGNDGLRKCVLRRFPYNLFYLEMDAIIWVAAVAHQRRRPNYWAGRKPPSED